MVSKIIIGVLGVGRIGKIHIENIIRFFPDVKIQAICDIQIKQLGNWAKSLGITNVTSDPSTIFRDPNVQAVLICSSTDTHSEFIIQAANAKKHIFCEKPIGNDLAKIRESLDVVKKMGVKLMLGFNRRFDHNFKRIKLTVKSGKIGLPHIIKITSRDPAPPPLEFLKRSGGLFFDMTIHDWDMARFLADDEVEEVYAVGSALIDPRIADFDIDTAVAVLKFKQGTLALIDNSRQAKYGYDQRVEVFGSEGAIIVDNDTPNTAKTFTSNSIESDKIHHFFLERYMQSYKDEMIEFLECLRDDNNPSVTGYDGIQAVLIAEAAKKSLMEHRPVTISEVDTK